MHIRVRKDWELRESDVTPEAVYRGRRKLLKNLGFGGVSLALGPTFGQAATGGFPTKLNSKYDGTGLKVTKEELVTGYNNFYEFSTSKEEPATLANKGWNTDPWSLEVTGLVNKPIKLDVNDWIKKLGGIEQRIYRFRCVEAWSMVVPWDGFPLSKLIAMVEPKKEAKFVKFTSFVDPKSAPGQRPGKSSINWPYTEGLTLDEANNELTLMVTGVFGKALPNQNGAGVRLMVPWKYGFKSIKSIVKIEFTKEQPLNTWQELIPKEYGFYANVNPKVSHPRWSQATEKVIGAGVFGGRQPTLLMNGYVKQVGAMYKGLDLTKNY